jgi:plastocyanin
VKTGATVTWHQNDPGFHTVTSGTVEQKGGDVEADPDGSFDSDRLPKGQTFEFEFDAAGSYAYFCSIHPATMRGVIEVG